VDFARNQTNSPNQHLHPLRPTTPLASRQEREKRKKRKEKEKNREWWFCKCLADKLPERKLVRAIFFAYFTSGIASWTNMLAKTAVDLLTDDSSLLTSEPVVWVIIIAVPFFAFLQLRLMAYMFASFEAVLIVPVFQSIFIFGLILEGIFYFQDFIGIAPVFLGLFGISVVLVIVGMFLLSR